MTRFRLPRNPSVWFGPCLFILALLFRLPYLGSFMTIDEVKWVEGAGQFTTALAGGDLFATYWHFFPGITITWGETVILWLQYLASDTTNITAFVENQMANLPGLIGAMRLSPVIITALGVAGVFWLARPLLGNGAALIGAGLLATDPFFVAHSRIVNGDAAAAVLMMLALLAFAQLWAVWHWSKVGLAGMFAGLALLTKLPAPIILPFMAVPAGLGYVKDKNWRMWLLALLLFGTIAAATFALLFPAMWVNPLETLRLIYVEAFAVGEIGEGHDTFFMGQISNNPGWLFYPYAITFRLTPVTLAGLLFLPAWLWSQRRALTGPRVRLVITLAAYVILVIVFANVSPKKLDRYVMAVIPALLLLAGVGLHWLIIGLAGFLGQRLAWAKLTPVLAAAVIALPAWVTVANYPYVLTTYNPLLGGFARAVEQVPVGWGEGMEQAAAWLNAQPDAANLRVSAWYSDMIRPYLRTQTVSFSSSGKDQLAADYVVFYINQTQRQNPSQALINYFAQSRPVFQVDREGTPYVWVYRAPAIQPVSGNPKIEGRAQLLGYKWQSESPLQADKTVEFTLYLLPLGPLPANETFTVTLATPDGQKWGQWQTNTSQNWRLDSIIEWSGRLTLPPNMRSADYQPVISLIDENTGNEVTHFLIESGNTIHLDDEFNKNQ